MNNGNFGFEAVELWKSAREFKNDIRVLLQQFPKEERFRLTDQVIKSSRSINALISEVMADLLTRTRFIIVYRQEALLVKLLTIYF